MSTTVTYKGSTITTLENETKTLTTAGMWLEDDIDIIDVSSSGGGNANVTQDANGYIVIDDDATGGGGGISLEDVLTRDLSGSLVSDFSGPTANQYLFCGTKITSVYLPNCTDLRDYFIGNTQYCSLLFAPNSNGSTNCASNAKGLTIAVIGADIWASFAQNCSNLEVLDISGITANTKGFVRTNSCSGCVKLKTVILRGSAVGVLSNINNFNNTPFASGGSGGTIYAPSALIDSYKSSTNWSTLDGYGTVTWKAIEGSYYETHYADGTVIS